jgi:hypothetical protein
MYSVEVHVPDGGVVGWAEAMAAETAVVAVVVL